MHNIRAPHISKHSLLESSDHVGTRFSRFEERRGRFIFMIIFAILGGSPKTCFGVFRGQTPYKTTFRASNARGELFFDLGTRRLGSGACWMGPKLTNDVFRVDPRKIKIRTDLFGTRRNPAGASLGEQKGSSRAFDASGRLLGVRPLGKRKNMFRATPRICIYRVGAKGDT